MIRDEFIAYDEDILSGLGFEYTSDAIMTRLAAYDQLAVAIDIRDAVFTGTLQVQATLLHSGDGINFTDKIVTNAGSTILATWTSSSYPGAVSGFDDGTYPGLPFMRIAIGTSVSGTGASFTRARMRLYVTARDKGGGRPFTVKRGYR